MIDLLYNALRTEYGLIVPTNSPERLRAKLYELRRRDPDLSVLTFKPSPTDPSGELWIIKREPVDAEGGRETDEAHSQSV